jgi:hypothetical protein
MLSGLFAGLSIAQAAPGPVTTSITIQFCRLFNTIHTIIFVLGLALMITGAAMYAGANVMPATQKGQLQGYGMGMIFGGVIGVILALAAPFILGIISGQSTLGQSCMAYGSF